MKLKVASIFIFIISFSFHSIAQHSSRSDSKIRELKIEIVTEKMSLTQGQLSKFLPLYNRYSDELFHIRREQKKLEKDVNADASYQVEKIQQLEEKIVQVKGKYKNEFLKIVTPQQLTSMYQGESEFKQILIERLKKKD